MINKWQNFFSTSWLDYKVTYDGHLRESSKKLFSLVDNAGLLSFNFSGNSLNKQPYRRAFDHPGTWKGIEARVPAEIFTFFKENFIDYLDIGDICMQLKVEELLHIDNYSIDQHNKGSRVNGLIPSSPESIPHDYSFTTSQWHTDAHLPLNNMVLMIYVDDVEEGMGECVVADPVRRLYNKIADDGNETAAIFEYIRDNSYIYTNKVSAKHITGPAGTVLGFNSHILHRANIPHKHRRRCIHFNIESPRPEHIAEGYLKQFGHSIVPLNIN